MLRRLLPFVLLACALVAPATARAHSVMHVPADAHRAHLAQAAAPGGADPATDPQIAQWLADAKAYWGAAPNCPDGISIQSAEWLPDPNVWAAAVQGGCAMAFDPDFYPAPADYDQGWYQAAMCSVVAHEWGHLLGNGHVSDPNNLMNPVTAINIVGGCPTWGIPAAAPAPEEATPAPAAEKTARRAAKKRSVACAGKARARSTRRAKAPKRCAAPRKRAKSRR